MLLDGSGSINGVQHGGTPGNYENKMLGFVRELSQDLDMGDGE